MKRFTGIHHSRMAGAFLATGIFIASLWALELTQLPSASTAQSANEAATRLFFDLLNGSDTVAAQELFTDDAAVHSPEGEYLGPEGARRLVATLDEAFPTVVFTIRQQASVEDTVIVRWSMVGTQFGDYQGQTASCAAVTTIGVAIFRFEDQLIDEQWMYYDRLALVRQIQLYSEIDPGSRPSCPNR